MSTLLEDAIAHHRAGRLKEAEGCYRHLLSKEPENADAIHLLGVLAHQAGDHLRGAQGIRKAIALRPTEAAFYNNLADALRSQGDYEQALIAAKKAIELNPNLAEGYGILGDLFARQGQLDIAEEALRRAIALNPKNLRSQNALATFLTHNRGADAALESFRTAVASAPHNAVALGNYGQALLDAGRVDEALEMLGRAVASDPKSAEVWNNFGNVFRARAQSEAALAMYRRALSLNPKLAMVHSNIGVLFAGVGRTDLAENAYRKAIEMDPKHPRPHSLLGGLLADARRYDEALECHRQAMEVAPLMGDPMVSMANCLIELNRYDEALPLLEAAQSKAGDVLHLKSALARWCHERGELERCARLTREVLAERPHSASALHLLVSADQKGVTEAEAAALAAVVDDPGTTIGQRCNGAFSLAALYDARKKTAEAARAMKLGNSLQSELRRRYNEPYDRVAHRSNVDRIIAGFSAERLAEMRGWGDPEARPIYILGMPRSGTTLTEQIVSSHPDVFGAGELSIISRRWESLPSRLGVAFDADIASKLTPELARELGHAVDVEMLALGNGEKRITDKMPDNYLHIGLIATMFPNASIVYVQRDLRDVTTSCYLTHFSSIRWANDTQDLAWRCQDHVRIMKHWQQVLGDRLLVLPYEQTVADLEGSARRLLDHCGLGWDPACLAFHQNERAVRTASVSQVREPIYSKSVAKWQRYAEFLPELYADIPVPEEA